MQYIVLIVNRYDTYDRHWIRCESLEEARKKASCYPFPDFQYEIMELGSHID